MEHPYNSFLVSGGMMITSSYIKDEAKIVQLFGEIDELKAEKVSRDLMETAGRDSESKRPVQLLISSPGGLVSSGQAIIDTVFNIRNSFGIDVHGIVYGHAASMAALLLQSCSKRYATEYSIIMIHGAFFSSLELDGDALSSYKKVITDITNNYSKLLASRTNVKADKWAKILRRSTPTHYTAKEALEIGVIDGIITNDGKLLS